VKRQGVEGRQRWKGWEGKVGKRDPEGWGAMLALAPELEEQWGSKCVGEWRRVNPSQKEFRVLFVVCCFPFL
jgi:hypothetical protein